MKNLSNVDIEGDKDLKKICIIFTNEKTMITVVISGGFDPIHIGHLRMMERQKK